MPGIEDKCPVPETLPAAKKEYLAADVEELVAAIKHNLQLKARPCHSVCSKHRRMSPYSTAGSKSCRQKMCDKVNSFEHSIHHSQCCVLKSKSPATDDPYEMLQELLREGSLIKEAVKRLQLDLENKRPKKPIDFYELDYENEDIEENKRPKKPIDFYELDYENEEIEVV